MSLARLAQLGVLGCAWSALAQDAPLHIEAPSGCITQDELAHLLEHDAPADGQIRITIEGAADTGWRARLQRLDADRLVIGERQLRAPPGACTQLDDALVFVVSTFLAELPATPLPEVAPPPPPPRPAPPRRHVPWGWTVSLGGGLGSGVAPAPFFAVAAAVEATHGRLGWRLGVLGVPRARVDLGGGAHADFAALLARLALCGLALESTQHLLDVCAGARAGPLFASAHGLAEDGRSSRAHAELELIARYGFWFRPRWGVYLGAAASLPLLSSTYNVLERDESARSYHQTTPGVSAELGALFALPL